MLKLKLLLVALTACALLTALALTASAQGPGGTVPPPYAGLQNPFHWNDDSAQKAGSAIYQRSCAACHGANGSQVSQANFSTADFPKRLEQTADFNFWILSEGRLQNGMPPYKGSLSEEQRWQTLTYLWSLGKPAEAPPTTPQPGTTPPAPAAKPTLSLTAPAQGISGDSVTLSATVKDGQGKPVANARVEFFIKVNFFVSGLMKIGEAQTDDKGIAFLEYAPRQIGDTDLVAHYQNVEATAKINLTDSGKKFYHTEVGIQFPSPGPEIFIGPDSSRELVNMGDAPTSAFRLPGGSLSWILIIAGIIALIWSTYFRVLFRVFHISAAAPRKVPGIDTRLLPLGGMILVALVGGLLVLMLLTGPYSHFHIP